MWPGLLLLTTQNAIYNQPSCLYTSGKGKKCYAHDASPAVMQCQLAAVSGTIPRTKYYFELGFFQMFLSIQL